MNREKDKAAFMLHAPLRKLIPAMALPSIASLLVTTIYNLTDTYFVSKLGTYAASAVGVNASIDQIITMAGCFFAVGAVSYVSRMLGAGRRDKAEQMLSACFLATVSIGVLALILGMVFMDGLVRLLGATDNILVYSKQYATYVLLAAPLVSSSFLLTQCLRAEGEATRAMIGSVIGAAVNIVLDPIFIFVFNLGIAGASIATAISKLVTFSILIYPYLTKNTILNLFPGKIIITRMDIKDVASVGKSSLMRNLLAALAAILLNNLAGRYSESALAAISVVNRLALLFMAFCLGLGEGFQPVAGFCWGAKHYARVKEAYCFSVKLALVGLAALCLAIFLLAGPIIGLFTKEDVEMLRLGILALRAQCIATPFHAIAVIINMLYIGIGKGRGATFLASSRQGICFLPVLPVMLALFGVQGVAIVQPTADILAALMSLFFARKAMKEIDRKIAPV